MALVLMTPLEDFIECAQATVTVFDFGDKRYVAKLAPEIAQEHSSWDYIEKALDGFPTTWNAYFVNIGKFGDTGALDCLAFTELLNCENGAYFEPTPRQTYWGWLHVDLAVIANPNANHKIEWIANPAYQEALDAIYHHLAATCKKPKH